MLGSGKSRQGMIAPEEFLILSAELHYLLSGTGKNKAIAALVLGSAKFASEPLLAEAIACLRLGYGAAKRKMGPLAALHPIRTAALLARSMPEPTVLDVLGTLFHDKKEDLVSDRMAPEQRVKFEADYDVLINRLDLDHRWFLGERVEIMRRNESDSYHRYLARIIEKSAIMPDLLRSKLADRLDNTLDVHLSHTGAAKYTFYRAVFDILFLDEFHGIRIDEYHAMPEKHELVLLLSQLFKNAIFLSLLRIFNRDKQDETVRSLFNAVAKAGILEAQWLVFEIFTSVITDPIKQREILVHTMEYCHKGGAHEIHLASELNDLDGSFVYYYGEVDDSTRKRRLAELFQDHEKLVRLVITFIAAFSGFINDPVFYLKGVTADGFKAVD